MIATKHTKGLNLVTARAAAKELLGPLAFAKISRYTGLKMVGKPVFISGGTHGAAGRRVNDYLGQGKTWEEAFTKARAALAKAKPQ